MDLHSKRNENGNQRSTTAAYHLPPTLNKFGTPYQCKPVDRSDNIPILRDYDTLIHGSLQSFVNLSRKIGGELTTMTDHVVRLFNAQKQFLQHAITHRKPTDEQQLPELIKPQSMEIEAISAWTNKNRKSAFFNHLSSISEGIPAMGWIVMSPAPAQHIKDMTDAAQFYTNRVLKEFKEKDPLHVDWVKQWLKVLNDLQVYVKQHHTTGLTWSLSHRNGTGGSGTMAPVPPTKALSNMQINDNGSRNGLMNSINALGTGVTSHLKKVPEEMKSHKNPQLREQNSIEVAKKPSTGTSNKTPTVSSGSPKFALEGNKWVVEYHSNRSDLKITETNMRHTVYIYKCSDCTIVVEGKVNSIVLDQCTKVGLQFTSVVSLVEFVNCRTVKAQVMEHVPTIQIEKTDGCHVYLSKASLNTQFITSKSSEMTVNVPIGDGEYKEYPIPEQFKTSFQNAGQQLVTVPNESAGV